MLVLVSGGAASGKSEFAESLVTARPGRRVYVATMRLWDDECRARAEKHLRMRAGKGFRTVERPEDLAGLDLPRDCGVLVEDLSNLCANEFFGSAGRAEAGPRVERALDLLARREGLTVVVTNELFSDGRRYDEDTAAYLDLLARLNRRAARLADTVYEVVCGIPVRWKGEGA